jgi:hypothetical protein
MAATILFTAVAPAGAAAPTGVLGADVSYPQCNGSNVGPLPGSGATQIADFGIIGVNNGRPGAANNCLNAEYNWATGLTAQIPQLYVNTADPGNTVADWPTAAVATLPSDPYGTCTSVRSRGKAVGANSSACAFEYGVEQAQHDMVFAQAAAAKTTAWWLDVETANSWQSRGTIGMNQADLLGMVETFEQTAGVTVGAYSTHYQWTKIVGAYDNTAGTTLNALAQWIPTGGSSQSTAQTDCTDTSALPNFTEGSRTYVQFTATFDYDVIC